MPTELVHLELEEVSLVDMGDDPLAKVAIFKRNPEGEDMENEEIDLEKQKVEIEVGSEDGGAGAFLFGFPVIPNPYLAAPAAGKISAVLACWDCFITIVDGEEMTIQRFDQTLPGTVVIYAEKRMASSIRDPFAGVFLKGV